MQFAPPPVLLIPIARRHPKTESSGSSSSIAAYLPSACISARHLYAVCAPRSHPPLGLSWLSLSPPGPLTAALLRKSLPHLIAVESRAMWQIRRSFCVSRISVSCINCGSSMRANSSKACEKVDSCGICPGLSYGSLSRDSSNCRVVLNPYAALATKPIAIVRPCDVIRKE